MPIWGCDHQSIIIKYHYLIITIQEKTRGLGIFQSMHICLYKVPDLIMDYYLWLLMLFMKR